MQIETKRPPHVVETGTAKCSQSSTITISAAPVKTKGIGITDTTMKRLLSQRDAGDLIACYAFLAYHCKQRGGQEIWANTTFIINGLSWSKERVRKAVSSLIGLGLLEDRDEPSEAGRYKGDGGKFKKRILRVRYLIGEDFTEGGLPSTVLPCTVFPPPNQGMIKGIGELQKESGITEHSSSQTQSRHRDLEEETHRLEDLDQGTQVLIRSFNALASENTHLRPVNKITPKLLAAMSRHQFLTVETLTSYADDARNSVKPVSLTRLLWSNL